MVCSGHVFPVPSFVYLHFFAFCFILLSATVPLGSYSSFKLVLEVLRESHPVPFWGAWWRRLCTVIPRVMARHGTVTHELMATGTAASPAGSHQVSITARKPAYLPVLLLGEGR